SECPCKLLPLSLSSFTAAEYGDIHSLSKIQNVATRRDDAGYTPLHFAAQFNHLAATALLLNLGCSVDGGGYCGATPLHRASFSGATATMKVILEWNSDDILPYISFGDESTPLHKAAGGGRYLAVHIILEALKERDSRLQQHQNNNTIRESSSSSKKSSWLQCGLEARDKYGRTSFDVAKQFHAIQDTERAAVARWDAVAGGVADWEKCIQLLQNANAAAVAATAVVVVNIEKESKTNN
ncbi:ankyrin, partial [Fragilariopsis cylindrus CCMP1102]